MDSQKITKQLEFIKTIDKMKGILRQNWLVDCSRREDDAGHSWHAATIALLFAEYAKPTVQVNRAIQMLLIHDLVEVYAGDTPCFDTNATVSQENRELEAAKKLYALLPEEQGEQLRALWMEFDAAQTDDARYAAAIDRLQPLILNSCTEGISWRGANVTRAQVYQRNQLTKEEIPALWPFVQSTVEACFAAGYLKG